MTGTKTLRALLFAAPIWIAPAYLSAQTETPAAPAAVPAASPAPSQAGATVEDLSARITAIQQRALQDPQIRAASQEVQALIQQAMAAEPNYSTYATRANTIKTDIAAAQAAQDNAKLRELAAEATQLQATIAAAQGRAREQPVVKEKLAEYTTKLFAKMVEIDPTVKELVAQLEALKSGGAAS